MRLPLFTLTALLCTTPVLGEGEAKTVAERIPAAGVGVGEIAQLLLGLLVVLLLIGLLAWLVRRMGSLPFGGSGVIRMRATLSLGQRERVVLIEVGDTQLLLGVAPGRVETLHVLESPIEFDERSSASEGFAERLAAAIARKGGEK